MSLDDNAGVATTTSTSVMPAHEAPVNDTINVRIVIVSIASIAATLIVCSTVMTMAGWSVPDWMGNAVIGAIGILGGLLASTSSRRT